MSVALKVLLIAFCLQAIAKFVVWFAVPYQTRIARIAAYYHRDGRIISAYDSLTLALGAALIVLLVFTGMHSLSFITGLVVGTLIIQIFFHRFSKPVPTDRAAETPTSPRQLMSYAIQANPALAWPEILILTVLFTWALYELVTTLLR